MYGVPTAKYVVNARVVDPEGNPIKGIEVVVSESKDFEDVSARLIETTTNDDGTLVENMTHGWPSSKLYVRFADVDGEENGGEFEEHIKDAYACHETNKIEEGDGSWYSGGYEVKVGEITLEPKSNDSEEPAEE
jgi:putative lipoprotein (rSAM/lipoprotein system)